MYVPPKFFANFSVFSPLSCVVRLVNDVNIEMNNDRYEIKSDADQM